MAYLITIATETSFWLAKQRGEMLVPKEQEKDAEIVDNALSCCADLLGDWEGVC